MKDRNEIKKALYKQNPKAEFDFKMNGLKNYSTEVVIDGSEEILEFKIPLSEMGENEFEDIIDAKFLIRWLV